MEGIQLAMQLSPTHAFVSMGWDSENRMTSANVDILSAPPGSPVNRIDNRYDPLHRRVLKQDSAWNASTGTWDLQSTTRFTYGG